MATLLETMWNASKDLPAGIDPRGVVAAKLADGTVQLTGNFKGRGRELAAQVGVKMNRQKIGNFRKRDASFKAKSPRVCPRDRGMPDFDDYAARIDAAAGIVVVRSRADLIAAGLLKPSKASR